VQEKCPSKAVPTQTPSTVNKCPQCGAQRHYVELEVKYKGITGHIDVVVQTRGGYIIGDYKTTSLEKLGGWIDKRAKKLGKPSRYLVSEKYVAQINSYAYIFRRLFKKKVVGCSLLFVARDDPRAFQEFHMPYTQANSQRIRGFLRQQTEAFQAAEKSVKTGDPRWAFDARMCQQQQGTDLDYYKKSAKKFFYRDCPWFKTCVGGQQASKCKSRVGARFKRMGLRSRGNTL